MLCIRFWHWLMYCWFRSPRQLSCHSLIILNNQIESADQWWNYPSIIPLIINSISRPLIKCVCKHGCFLPFEKMSYGQRGILVVVGGKGQPQFNDKTTRPRPKTLVIKIPLISVDYQISSVLVCDYYQRLYNHPSIYHNFPNDVIFPQFLTTVLPWPLRQPRSLLKSLLTWVLGSLLGNVTRTIIAGAIILLRASWGYRRIGVKSWRRRSKGGHIPRHFPSFGGHQAG